MLNLAYNALCDGTHLEDIELRRNDEVFLDALDAERIEVLALQGEDYAEFEYQPTACDRAVASSRV